MTRKVANEEEFMVMSSLRRRKNSFVLCTMQNIVECQLESGEKGTDFSTLKKLHNM